MAGKKGAVSRGLRVLAPALSLASLATAGAHAQLVGAKVVSGQATITQTATGALIQELTPKASITYNSLNVPKGFTLTVQSSLTNPLLINTVTGGTASYIAGLITGNVRFWLINPAGITVAPGGMINTASVLLSTLAPSAHGGGNYTFGIPGNPGAGVVNYGTITATGGYAVLAGEQVSNSGVIVASLGNVVLAGGAKTYAVDFAGDHLLSFAITTPVAQANGALVSNTGKIAADGGMVLLTAASAKSVLDNVINTSGIIEATSVASVDGKIVLTATGGGTAVAGTLDASGKGAGQTGGEVDVLSDRSVTLASGALVDVSGDAGGGTALIGGNFHGAGPQQNAASTTVASGARIDADALSAGDGGGVAVWSNGSTVFAGAISAEGGAEGGNGGHVETSGVTLAVSGSVTTLARNGAAGTWLLDPADLTICNSDCTISPDAITAALGGSDVVIEATTDNTELAGSITGSFGGSTGNILVSDAITYTSPNQLSLLAEGNITVNANILNYGAGNLNFVAGWDGVTGLSGGSFSMAAIAANPASYIHNGGAVTVAPTAFVGSLGGGTAYAGASIVADPVISDASFSVGVDGSGALYDSSSGIGFKRLSDSFDPLAPGSPRDSWGVSYTGAVTGEAQGDPVDFNNINETTTFMTFAGSTGTVVNTTTDGALSLTQNYSLTGNTLTIHEMITNLSSGPLMVTFQRDIDWDVAPTETEEITTIPGVGSSGPADLGAGIKVGLGTLGISSSVNFSYFYGISQSGETPTALAGDLSRAGANFVITTESSDGGSNTAALGSSDSSPLQTTFYGFENPNPTVAYAFTSPSGPGVGEGGGSTGTGASGPMSTMGTGIASLITPPPPPPPTLPPTTDTTTTTTTGGGSPPPPPPPSGGSSGGDVGTVLGGGGGGGGTALFGSGDSGTPPESFSEPPPPIHPAPNATPKTQTSDQALGGNLFQAHQTFVHKLGQVTGIQTWVSSDGNWALYWAAGFTIR